MAHAPVHDIDAAREELRRERLRANAPAVAAVVMLFGLVLAGALALERLLDLGIWLLGSGA